LPVFSRRNEVIMKSTMIIDSISLTIDSELLCNSLRVKPGSEFAVRLKELAADAHNIARPKAAYREVKIINSTEDSISLEGIQFKSRLLSTNLTSATKLYAFVATCGTELEAWAKNFSDLLERFWADTIMDIALGVAVQTLEKHLTPLCDVHLSCMNPGSLEDWPLTEQRPLFNLLGEASVNIGITLTESYLLLPLKSVSGIYFDSSEHFCNCQLCPRESCPNRRMPRIDDNQK
jgi:hypothetical protein